MIAPYDFLCSWMWRLDTCPTLTCWNSLFFRWCSVRRADTIQGTIQIPPDGARDTRKLNIRLRCKHLLQLHDLHIGLKCMCLGFFGLQVSVKIRKHSDEAVWIRVAWGENLSRPNHLKPTYIVHHLQTPYVFVTSLTSKQKPPLFQVRKKSFSCWHSVLGVV